jgi:hypothetical protein
MTEHEARAREIPLTHLLPEHYAVAAKLPAEERPWFFMRLGKLLARKPAIPNAHLLAYGRSITR